MIDRRPDQLASMQRDIVCHVYRLTVIFKVVETLDEVVGNFDRKRQNYCFIFWRILRIELAYCEIFTFKCSRAFITGFLAYKFEDKLAWTFIPQADLNIAIHFSTNKSLSLFPFLFLERDKVMRSWQGLRTILYSAETELLLGVRGMHLHRDRKILS
jgi:hypothetical protein